MADRLPPPDDLVRFMETFQSPAGESPVALLQRYDGLFNGGGPSVEVHRKVPVDEVDGWRLTADVYQPPVTATRPYPVLTYFHGGGWIMGNPASHDRMAREFAAAGFLVASVDYPRAPKWRFPAAYDATMRSVRGAAKGLTEFGGDGNRLAVGGDSAGGNLAAAVLATTEQPVRAGLLLYGIYDFHRALPALAPLIGGEGSDEQLYLPPEQVESLIGDPRLSPEYAADRFPPCWLGAGSRDPLVGETEALAAALQRAGVPHELHIAADAPHSYLQMPFHEHYASAHASMQEFLRKHV